MSDHGENCSSCDESEKNPSDDLVMNKYKMAGEVASVVIKCVSDKCIPGASIVDICQYGDALIIEHTSKVFVRDKQMKKGIAFPTSVSLNNCICHYSPLLSETPQIIQKGDLVKIDLAVHIDGFIAAIATTIAAGATKEEPITGRKADVVIAAYSACETTLRLFKPGKTNYDVTDVITAVAADFNCKPCEGLLSHNFKKDVLEGSQVIMLNPTDAMKKDYAKFSFQPWHVYGIDVFVSTNPEPKTKERDVRTTIYRRTDNNYNLKLKVSRELYSTAINKFGDFAFTIRSLDDEKKVRLGLQECIKHHLLMSYPVLHDKDGEYVAHFKFTVIVGPNGPIRVTTPPFLSHTFKSDLKLHSPELLKLMNEPLNTKVKKDRKAQIAADAKREVVEEPQGVN